MAAFGVAAAGLGGAALATPVTILNPSFETVAAGEPTDGNYSLAPHVNTNSIAGTYNDGSVSWKSLGDLKPGYRIFVPPDFYR